MTTGAKVLIVGECSGRMRQAFRRRGFDARSCDLKPAEDGEQVYHYQGDIHHLHPKTPWMWDLDGLIAHPVCRRLANSGAKHLYVGMRKENGIDPQKWADLEAAVENYRAFKAIPARHKAVENPIMHEHAARLIGKRADQFVQPWWFGEPFFKATGFDLENLPKLVPTNKLTPPKPGTPEHKAWSAVHREPPGPEREANRSRSFVGICEAAAEQWGNAILADVMRAAA
jgi:hypothetical protein